MAISIKQLQYFIVLSEELHFSNAAKRLNISQPPLSVSMKQLEEELGFKLIERNRKQVSLTLAGTVFAEEVRNILSNLDHAKNLAWKATHNTQGHLSIGFVPAMLFRKLPETLRKFQDLYPDLNMQLSESNTNHQIEEVVRERLDVGFIHSMPLPDEVDEMVLETERLVVCVPSGHRLAKQMRISLDEIVDEKIILFSREFAPQYYDRLVEILATKDIKPHDDFHIQHWLTIIALVSKGFGISLVPRSLIHSQFGDVVYLELSEINTQYAVSVVWHKENKNPALSSFLNYLKRARPQMHWDV